MARETERILQRLIWWQRFAEHAQQVISSAARPVRAIHGLPPNPQKVPTLVAFIIHQAELTRMVLVFKHQVIQPLAMVELSPSGPTPVFVFELLSRNLPKSDFAQFSFPHAWRQFIP